MNDLNAPWHEGGNEHAHGVINSNGDFVCITPDAVFEIQGGFAPGVASVIAAAPDLLAGMRALYRAYVSVLESGRDRIVFLGGGCDTVEVMEEGDPALRAARAAIAKAEGGGA